MKKDKMKPKEMKKIKSEKVYISGSFDDMTSRHYRFLQEASKLGVVTVYLWSDEAVKRISGKDPKFPLKERLYILQAIRYIKNIKISPESFNPEIIPIQDDLKPDIWVVKEESDTAAKRSFCEAGNIRYKSITDDMLSGFPKDIPNDTIEMKKPENKKVIVTGCFDWFHSGHIRFFEEVSELGDLYVIVGHDENIRLLKGEGHPHFSQEERRFVVQSIRYINQTLISSGTGWMDAEPEIDRIKPDIYAVNEDGDKSEKRTFCEEKGIEYVVLKRKPSEGLLRRTSTKLRGF